MKPLIQIKDPGSEKVWEIDTGKKIRNIYADVNERWVINCVVPQQIIRKIVPLDFLEPVLVKGKAILSLCAIFMTNAAPDWIPLQFGPASKNCALRVACMDIRDGSHAVWVDPRHTDSFWGPVIGLLGFPPVHTGLKVYQNETQLDFVTKNNSLQCLMKKAEPQESDLFPKSEEFDEYFCSGVRSYSQHERNADIDVIDLHKLKDNKFEKMNFEGVLKTEYGNWITESVYLTRNGHYHWVFEDSIKLT